MGSLLPDRFVPEGVGIEVILSFSARDSYSQRFGPKRFNAFKQNFKKNFRSQLQFSAGRWTMKCAKPKKK